MDLAYIDAHCHADLLLQRDDRFPEAYRIRQCGGISWSYPEGIDTWQGYPGYWSRLRGLAERLSDEGLPFYYLIGIHPRCIPEDLQAERALPGALAQAIHRHLADPLCLGLGEIGLDAASDTEKRILCWQLDLAAEHLPQSKRIGIHTPRADKEPVTREILDLLRGYEPLKDRVLIDHVSPKTYPLVSKEGYSPVGMTLQPGKTSLEDLVRFIREDPNRARDVVLNSDSAKAISEWFLNLVDNPDTLLREEVCRLLLDNARDFYCL
jgi:hypothetical protein